MRFEFTKMHGLGNDFVVFNAIGQVISLDGERCRQIADRRFGVGCDQILLVEPPRDDNTDFYYRIFNADGSEVEQCGNGARCFARFVQEQGLTDQNTIRVGTQAGVITLYLEGEGQVRVNMGVPKRLPDQIPFLAEAQAIDYSLEVDNQQVRVAAVSMGNPHAVLLTASISEAPVAQLGPKIERHPRFPNRTNVGFMQIVSREQIHLRVYERGCGETLACGSGACAAVVAGITQGLLDEKVTVSLPGGDLVIKWQGEGEPVWMSGPATTVYEGKIEL